MDLLVLAAFRKHAAKRLRPSHILITGIPGSGKTTEGKRLSKEMGLPLVSLDGIAAKNKRWAGTADARRFIKKLDAPHIVEGTQLLGFHKKDLQGHDLRVMEQPRKEIVDRLVRRGWNDGGGVLHVGEAARPRLEQAHDEFVGYANRFKARIKKTAKG